MKNLLLILTLVSQISFSADKPNVYWEKDGIVAVEIESMPAIKGWKKDTEFPGFSGDCYYTWKGPNLFGSPGSGVLKYRVRITKPGKYTLEIHNRHQHHDSTEANDCFTTMNNGKWVKTFSSQRDKWLWQSTHEHGHGKFSQANYDLPAGEHVLMISGRSNGFSIDRFHLKHSSVKKSSLTQPLSIGNFPPVPAYLKDRQLSSSWNRGKLGMVIQSCKKMLEEGENEQATKIIKDLESFCNTRKEQLLTMQEFSPASLIVGMKQLASQFSYTEHEKEIQLDLMALNKNKDFQNNLRAEKMYLASIKSLDKFLQRRRPKSRTPSSLIKAVESLKRMAPDSFFYEDLNERVTSLDSKK
ncbi:MAG: hypothetical protein NE334_10775 [Lentisphaeraceae bacterium]|nr:hypothetical protein [Lentisphaeraceae bacterium]